MANYTQFLNDLNVKIQNKSNAIPVSVRTFINQTLRNVVSEYDFASTMRHTKTFRAIFDDVNRYPLPADMKSEALVDIQKYKNFDQASYTKYRKVSPNVFRTMQEMDTVSFDYSDGLSWLLGYFDTDYQTTIMHDMESLTSNGTWTADDDGENIALNSTNYIAGSSSISVDMATAGTVLSLVNSDFTALDLTGINKLFVWVYLPVATNLTTITLLYGSSALAYYTTTATTPYNVTSFEQGWNLIGFDAGTATGSPDIENIDYAKLSLTYSVTPTTLTGFLFDSLMASEGNPVELSYYSKYPWRTSAGSWLLDSTSNEDILNATETEYEVWLNKCAYEASKAIPLSTEQIQLLRADYMESKNNYANKYPSCRIKERNYLYRPQNVNKKFIRLVKTGDVKNSL